MNSKDINTGRRNGYRFLNLIALPTFHCLGIRFNLQIRFLYLFGFFFLFMK